MPLCTLLTCTLEKKTEYLRLRGTDRESTGLSSVSAGRGGARVISLRDDVSIARSRQHHQRGRTDLRDGIRLRRRGADGRRREMPQFLCLRGCCFFFTVTPLTVAGIEIHAAMQHSSSSPLRLRSLAAALSRLLRIRMRRRRGRERPSPSRARVRVVGHCVCHVQARGGAQRN